VASTHDHILCFTNMGQVLWLKVYNLPEATRTSKGRSITNLLSLREGEDVTSLLRVPEFDDESFVVFATRRGVVKKTVLSAYSRPKRGGIKAILLEEGDAVVGVSLCRKGDTILMASSSGRAIRFDEQAARAMGRTARGVRGIKLKGDDEVVGMIVAEEGADLLTVCENGHGKRTPLEDYPIKGRGGQGVINIRTTTRNGPVVAVRQCRAEDDAMLITERGMIIRSHVETISCIGRNTQGVRIVNLRKDDHLVAIEVVSEADLERFNSPTGNGERRASAEEASKPESEVPSDPEADPEVEAEPDTETDSPGEA
jgi:DNA gyrase subunit A